MKILIIYQGLTSQSYNVTNMEPYHKLDIFQCYTDKTKGLQSNFFVPCGKSIVIAIGTVV